MARPYHIIITDDDEDDIFIMREAIKMLSLPVEVTSILSGVELIAHLENNCRHNLPDLILLDINMPVMDGLEVLEKIRRDPDLCPVPVVVLSTLRTVDRIDRSLSLGAKNFFSKPNELSGYKAILDEILFAPRTAA